MPPLLRRLPAGALLLAILSCVAAGHAAPASAQAPTPADSAAVLLEAARSFEAEGRAEVAGAIYTLILERYAATPAGAAARAHLAEAPDRRLGRGSRTELQVWGTLYGIWLGIAVPTAFGSDAPEAYGAGLLLGAPAGLLLARSVMRARPLGEGQVRAITWGGTWGTWQGFGWAEVFDLGSETICESGFCFESGGGNEERFASMIVGGLAGAAAGAWIGRDPVAPGVASGAHYGSLWGSWLGVAGAVIGDLEDDDIMVATLLTGNAGLVAGALLARRYDLSRNRIRLMSLGGLMGGLAGVGFDLIAQPDDEDGAITIPLLLSGAGLALAAHMTRSYDRAATSDPRGGSALLRLDHGAWSLELPMPTPTRVPVPDATGRYRWRPALSFSLMRGWF